MSSTGGYGIAPGTVLTVSLWLTAYAWTDRFMDVGSMPYLTATKDYPG